ncbi:MAG: hypothetical protein NDJ89_12895 [Oligoflexia bacterium]|nr:hypothetical protein [Oligoflexia bacterium]
MSTAELRLAWRRFWPLGLLLLIFFHSRAAAADPEPAQLREADQAILRNFPALARYSPLGPGCVRCHERHFIETAGSVHGRTRLLRDLPAGTLCLTCHDTNHIATNPARVARLGLPAIEKKPYDDLSCMRCHADPVVAKAFGFPAHVPGEFEQSIHYRKAMLGERKAPLCHDCHGTHRVAAVRDPGSPLFEAQRVKVCASCHAGANLEFTATFDHRPITREEKATEFWTIAAFKTLTLSTFLLLGLYVLMDFITIVRIALTPGRRRHAPGHAPPAGRRYVLRLDLHTRIQHFMMFSSVIILVITGWPLFEPRSGVARSLMGFFGGAGATAVVHRLAGLLMIGSLVYHLGYLYLKFLAGGRGHPMLPTFKDLRDVGQMALYFLGLRNERPEFERFSFIEKFDYWAVFWGVAMMGVSGLILMFPTIVTQLLPSLAVRLALIVHADEALLAAIVLFIWHFYNVHLRPGIFPMNWAWLTGRMPEEVYEEEHAAEVRRLKARGEWPAAREDG